MFLIFVFSVWDMFEHHLIRGLVTLPTLYLFMSPPEGNFQLFTSRFLGSLAPIHNTLPCHVQSQHTSVSEFQQFDVVHRCNR